MTLSLDSDTTTFYERTDISVTGRYIFRQYFCFKC